MRGKKEGDHLQANQGGFGRNQTCPHLGPELLAFRSVRLEFLLFKLPSWWYFVMAVVGIQEELEIWPELSPSLSTDVLTACEAPVEEDGLAFTGHQRWFAVGLRISWGKGSSERGK